MRIFFLLSHKHEMKFRIYKNNHLNYSKKAPVRPRNSIIQEQPTRGVHKKRCSENMYLIYRRTPMSKCDFNKVARQLYWNHTLAWIFSCNLLHIFSTSFSKKTSEWLFQYYAITKQNNVFSPSEYANSYI